MARFPIPQFRTASIIGRGLAVVIIIGLCSPAIGAQSTAKSAKPDEAKASPPKPAEKKLDAPAAAEKAPEAKAPPHFASLRRDKVNLRSGPSEDYPIQWEYHRKGLPVEIIAAFDVWRKVRDFDGTEGWVNQLQLVGPRSVLVTGAVRSLRREARDDGAVIALLEPGVVAALAKCDPVWCELRVSGYRGWLKRDQVWGLEPGEIIQ